MTSVTIITVCFNAAATLARTMQSVLEQTHAVDQYIVIDGGSTDGTQKLIEDYAEKFGGRLQWVSERDHGIYDAMNKGLARATGDIIGILNADDWYEFDAVATVLQTAATAPGGIYYGLLRKMLHGRERAIVREHHSFLGQDNIPHPATFVHRSIYQQHGAFDLQYKLAADYELLLRFYRAGVIFTPIDRILTNFAVGGASLQQARRMWIETIAIRRRYGTLSAGKYWVFRALIEARAFVERFVLKERVVSA